MALSLSLSRAPRKGAARVRLRSATSAWTTPRVTLAGHILCLSFSRAHVLCRASALPLVPHMAFGDVCRRSISLSPSRRPPRQARPSGSLPVFRGSGRGPGAGATTRHPHSFQNRVALAFQILGKGTWCSGITSASHAEGPGFKPQCVHVHIDSRSEHRASRRAATNCAATSSS